MSIRATSLIIITICLSLTFGCSDQKPELTYSVVYTDRDGYIYEMRPDGSEKKKLFETFAWSPMVSPNSRFVAAYTAFSDSKETWLILLAVQSKQLTKLALVRPVGVYSFETNAWSPDGLSIAFSGSHSDVSGTQIFAVDVSTKNASQLTESGPSWDPKWSPSQDLISYMYLDSGALCAYFMDSNGGNRRPAPYRRARYVSYLTWHPGGMGVAFDGPPDSSDATSNSRNVYIADTEGKVVRQLTFDDQSGSPCWSPDGSRIAFYSKRAGGTNLFVMSSNGADQTQITRHGKALPAPYRWSPDGKFIIYGYDAGSNGGLTLHVTRSDGSADFDTGAPFRWGFSWLSQ